MTKGAVVTGVLATIPTVVVFAFYARRQSAELADLRAKVASLPSATAASPAGETRIITIREERTPQTWTSAPIASAPTGGGATPPTEVTSLPLTVDERRESLDVAFYADGQPPLDWGGKPRTVTIEKARALLPPGSELDSFECRGTMCRIESTHVDKGRYTEFVEKAFLSPDTLLWNAPAFIARRPEPESPGGAWVMVAYIAQPGAQLPQ
jgi:hypothetical protein